MQMKMVKQIKKRHNGVSDMFQFTNYDSTTSIYANKAKSISCL